MENGYFLTGKQTHLRHDLTVLLRMTEDSSSWYQTFQNPHPTPDMTLLATDDSSFGIFYNVC